jgi:acyl-homoserine-lactone acylase
MTMVMADNQDIFLEKLRIEGGKYYYLPKGQWLPPKDRKEVLKVKGGSPVTITIRETCHGPLLNNAIGREPKVPLQPVPVESPYGLALSWTAASDDEDSLNTFFSISRASSVDEVFPSMKRIRAIALNMVFADRDNIGWQVTGNYPIRSKGRGLMPSPGWTGEYDWKGLIDPGTLPSSKNPPEQFIGTANNRTVPRDYRNVLSSSWYWPERAERIAQMVAATDRHTLETCMNMHLDTHSLFVTRLKDALFKGNLAGDISREIESLSDEGKKTKARLALESIKGFDGDMAVASKGASVVSALLDCATKDIFLDEMGPEESRAWKAFIVINNESYNATCDHLIVRGDESPFFDDIKTPVRETKAAIIARSLVHAVESLETGLSKDPENGLGVRYIPIHGRSRPTRCLHPWDLSSVRPWTCSAHISTGVPIQHPATTSPLMCRAT